MDYYQNRVIIGECKGKIISVVIHGLDNQTFGCHLNFHENEIEPHKHKTLYIKCFGIDEQKVGLRESVRLRKEPTDLIPFDESIYYLILLCQYDEKKLPMLRERIKEHQKKVWDSFVYPYVKEWYNQYKLKCFL